MPNPFYQSNLQNYKSMYNMLVNSKNPVQAFNTMARNNPQLQPIVNMLNQGMTPQSIFNTMCQQRGIDPNEFLKTIQS